MHLEDILQLQPYSELTHHGCLNLRTYHHRHNSTEHSSTEHSIMEHSSTEHYHHHHRHHFNYRQEEQSQSTKQLDHRTATSQKCSRTSRSSTTTTRRSTQEMHTISSRRSCRS